MKLLFIGCWSTLLALICPLANAGIPKVLLGDWQGVFQCGDSEFNFTLGLREQEERLSGNVHYKAVNGERLGVAVNSQLIGSGEGFGNSLSIETITNDISKRVWIRMLYDEKKDRLFGKIDFHGSEVCSYAIAEKSGINKLKKELSKNSKAPGYQWIDGQTTDSINRWMARIKQDIKQERQASEVDVAWLRNHLAFFKLPEMASLKILDQELSVYRISQAKKNQTNELDKLMKLEPNWANLLALTQVNPDRNIDPDVRRKMIDSVRTHIAKHWQSAFKKFFADQDDTLETARDKLVPLSRQTDTGSMMHYLPEGAISVINNMILERRLKLAADFAAHESKNYYQAFPEPENYVASIKRWEQIERDLKQTYQDLLRDPPFYEFNAQRHAHYKSLLEKGQSALIVEINKINSPTELDAWFNQAFPWDLIDEEARASRVNLRLNRLAEIAPFYGADKEEYFNAIFRGDINQIKQFERQHLDSTININLLPGVVSVYLLEYEKRRTRVCLRSDAIPIDVTTTRSGTETRDGMGILINQTPEYTTYSRLRVNKEFTSIVPKIKLAAINPGGGHIGFIGGQIEDLHNSMRRVMDTYPCDSIQIKTLERNFIKLYED